MTEPMTEEQLNLISETTNHATRKALNHYRRQALVGFAILLLGIGGGVAHNHNTSVRARSVLCKIITDGDRTVYQYEREKLLTHQQVTRALEKSAQYRKEIGPAPGCSEHITPPPPPPGPLSTSAIPAGKV